VSVIHLFQQIGHGVLHARAQTQIAALTPAADDIAAVAQEGAQRPGRDVGGDQSRQYQHGVAVAARRQ
jgi:hypothetical protein